MEAAQRLFGDRLALAERYTEHLASSGIVRGLIGPREAPRLWERHVLNCAVVQELIPENARVVDVGSGAGLPGLCLALARPDIAITLVEPLERRVQWLDEVIEDLELPNVTVLRTRAEQAKTQLKNVDVVTARAVSALTGLMDITLPLLKGSGQLLALKGRTAPEELAEAVATRPQAREAQRVLAEDVTTLVHGADATDRVRRASQALFGRLV